MQLSLVFNASVSVAKKINHRAFACRECEYIERPVHEKKRHPCPRCNRGMQGLRPKAEFDTIVKFLGFDNYDKYLKSSFWKEIRSRILARDDHKCQCCGAKTDVVHHTSYDFEVMEGHRDKDLISVCNDCHYRMHFDENRNRLTLEQANKRMKRFMEVGEFSPKRVWEDRSQQNREQKKKRKRKRSRSKGGFYVVWKGRETGIFNNWSQCSFNVKGYSGARYAKFSTYEEAKRMYEN